nr:MAG TPA: hypothetical protein [Bacteriophage sp.]
MFTKFPGVLFLASLPSADFFVSAFRGPVVPSTEV